MNETNKHMATVVPLICVVLLLGQCAITNRPASEHSFGQDCAHCHGEHLEGNRNTKKQCGECHDVSPLPVDKVQSEKIKAIVLSEPHVHTTKNLFGNNPSCFICHRQKDF